MKIGSLMYDNSADPLEDKISRAAEYYARKYGKTPNVCFVNPAQQGTLEKAGEIAVRTNRSILPNHLWLGVDEQA